MALTTTTLSAAVAVKGATITVASAAGVPVGSFIRVAHAMMNGARVYTVGSTTVNVLRGQDGTVTAAHPSSANASVGLASDFANPASGSGDDVTYSSRPARDLLSYSAAGAITLPSAGRDMVAVIIGTST